MCVKLKIRGELSCLLDALWLGVAHV